MDYIIKDEPLELDLNLLEQFTSHDGKVLTHEIKSLVKGMQIILQESKHDLKIMQESFEKMKKRHAENLKITSKVLRLLTAYSTPPIAPCHDQTINITGESSDDGRIPEVSQELSSKTSLNDEFELLSYSLSCEPLNITTTTKVDNGKATRNDVQEPPENESHVIDDHLVEHPLPDIGVSKREIKRERPVKDCLFCPKNTNGLSNKMKASPKLPTVDDDNEFSLLRKRMLLRSNERFCPLDGCEKRGKFKRLDSHLKRKHKLSIDSETYKALCPANEEWTQDLNCSYQELSGKRYCLTPEVNVESSGNMTRSYEDDVISPSASKSQEADDSYLKHRIKGRTTFSKEQRQKIREVFQEYIDGDCLPSIPTIRKMMREDGHMISLVKQNNYQPCQFKGCLLSIINKRKKRNSTSRVRVVKSEL